MKIKLAERLKCLRQQKKISQGKLAEALGVDAAFIGHIENNRSSISLETLVILVEFFGCTAGYLIGTED